MRSERRLMTEASQRERALLHPSNEAEKYRNQARGFLKVIEVRQRSWF